MNDLKQIIPSKMNSGVIVLLVLVGLVVLFFLFQGFSALMGWNMMGGNMMNGNRGFGGMMHNQSGGMFGVMGFFGPLLMLLFWGGLLGLAIWLLSLIFPTGSSSNTGHNTALSTREILDTRYAKGEINKEEYQDMLHTLQGKQKEVIH